MKLKHALHAALAALAILAGACGQDGDPGPEPTPQRAHSRLEVLRGGGGARLSLTLDGRGGPVFLRGQRGSFSFGTGQTHIATIDTQGCTITRHWSSQQEYLDAMQRNRLNLLHVELWNVWEPDSPYPFQRDAAGKFRVQAAVEQGQWNEEYFRAVRSLVQEASARGIAVVVNLVNYYNIRISDARHGGRPWAAEPFRAANSDTLFGLGEYGGETRRRMAEFLRFAEPDGRLTQVGRVQKALVERLLDEMLEQNVVFELLMTPWLINNPYADSLSLARWQSWLISVIRAKEQALGRSAGVRIMVTPATLSTFELYVGGRINSDFDVVQWKQAYQQGRAGYEGWAEVDLLSYPGFFAFGDPPFPAEAAGSMRERIDDHRARFPETVAVFNTDGFNQRFAPTDCRGRLDSYVEDVRHGWWNQLVGGVDLSRYPLAWAERTHALGASGAGSGSVHFLNWTTAQPSMEDLAAGAW